MSFRRMFLVLGGGALVACASAPPPPPPPPVVEAPPDPYDEFDGEKVSGAETVKLANEPVGVDNARLVLKLVKTAWTEMPRPDGTVARDGTASILVQRGLDYETIMVQEGDYDSAFGVRITVQKLGETYNEAALRYVAYAEVLVGAAP